MAVIFGGMLAGGALSTKSVMLWAGSVFVSELFVNWASLSLLMLLADVSWNRWAIVAWKLVMLSTLWVSAVVLLMAMIVRALSLVRCAAKTATASGFGALPR